MNRRIALAAFAAASALAAPAIGQSFNIDFEPTFAGGPGSGAPQSGFGAAAGQVGTWHGILGGLTANTPVTLNGLNGVPTAVTISSPITLQGFGTSLNGNPPGNDGLLLNDALNLGFPGTLHSFTFSNLANGSYDVFVYAMAPDSASYLTSVNVNGPATGGSQGAQLCGGAYPGLLAAPITHVEFNDVVVNAGQMVINTENTVGFGSLAGIQLVHIPGPGGLAVVALASMIGHRRRRWVG